MLMAVISKEVAGRLVPSTVPEPAREQAPLARNPPPRPETDPLRDLRDPRGRAPYVPGGNPFAVGGDDLNPFGGFGGPLGGGMMGGGMMIGPNHPGFGPGGFGPGGAGMPRGMRPPPPGARFDPTGPRGLGGDPDWDDAPPPGASDMFM